MPTLVLAKIIEIIIFFYTVITSVQILIQRLFQKDAKGDKKGVSKVQKLTFFIFKCRRFTLRYQLKKTYIKTLFKRYTFKSKKSVNLTDVPTGIVLLLNSLL